MKSIRLRRLFEKKEEPKPQPVLHLFPPDMTDEELRELAGRIWDERQQKKR